MSWIGLGELEPLPPRKSVMERWAEMKAAIRGPVAPPAPIILPPAPAPDPAPPAPAPQVVVEAPAFDFKTLAMAGAVGGLVVYLVKKSGR